MAVERSFYKELLYKRALDSPMNEGLETETNPRTLEAAQMIRLMNLFADIFLDEWESEIGSYRLEHKAAQDDAHVPAGHLRASRICRDEILATIVWWVGNVIDNYFAQQGEFGLARDKHLHRPLPDQLWQNIQNFLRNVADLPLWRDTELSGVVFGTKQTLQFWRDTFASGETPTAFVVLAKPFGLEMIARGPRGSS